MKRLTLILFALLLLGAVVAAKPERETFLIEDGTVLVEATSQAKQNGVQITCTYFEAPDANGAYGEYIDQNTGLEPAGSTAPVVCAERFSG